MMSDTDWGRGEQTNVIILFKNNKICLKLKSLCLESCSPMGLSFTGNFKITSLLEHALIYFTCGLLYLHSMHTLPEPFGQE